MDIEQLPPHEKYWASPEPSKNGDETDTEVFAAVGQALSSWEVLESIVVNLFVLFAQSYSPAVIRAYGSIDSAIGRWNAMKAAADSCFSIHNVLEQDIKKFGTFHKHWQVAISRRNEIAHGIVTRVRIDDKDRGHFLCPARYNTKKNHAGNGYFSLQLPRDEDEFGFMSGKYRYTKGDIFHFNERFNVLHQAAFHFRLHLIRTYPLMWDLSLPPAYSAPDESGDTSNHQ